jgi:hypothetical protein
MKKLLALLLLPILSYASVYEILISVESDNAPVITTQIVNDEPTPEPDPEPTPDPTPTPEPTPTPPLVVAGTWTKSATGFQSVWSAPSDIYSNSKRIFSYSSGAWDPVAKEYWMFAMGGHLDQIDNSIYKYNGVTTKVLSHQPHAANGVDYVVYGPAVPYKLNNGFMRPMSAHTYSGSVVIGEWLYSSRYAPHNPNGGASGGDWRYNTSTGQIQELAQNPQAPAAVAVNVNGVLFHFGNTGLSRLNADLTYTNDNYTDGHGWLQSSQPLYACGAYDQNSNRVIVAQPLGIAVWQVNNVTDAVQLFPSWTGATEIVGAGKSGCGYSSTLGGVLIYNQDISMSDVFYVDVTNNVITRIDISGTPDTINMSGEGIYNKFYADGNNVYLFTDPNTLFSAGLN